MGYSWPRKVNFTKILLIHPNFFRFKTITSAYYKGCNGIMLVFDITDKASFENIDSWLDKCKVNCPPNVIMMLIGNKADLESDRQVSREEA